MKKIFKALSILAASAAIGTGVIAAAGCNGGTNGTYTGEYHYLGYYGQEYGMVVEVTVENNIITKVKDITNTKESENYQKYKKVEDGVETGDAYVHEWHTVSAGWDSYFMQQATTSGFVWILFHGEFIGLEAGKLYYKNLEKGHEGEYIEWDGTTIPEEAATAAQYGWSTAAEQNWTKHTSWLLDQYVGWSVADVLALNVYTDYGYTFSKDSDNSYGTVLDKNAKGEPYEVSFNTELTESGLLISGSTQGSGRLLLAVQDALSK